jgi:hypothetical protein
VNTVFQTGVSQQVDYRLRRYGARPGGKTRPGRTR